MRKITAGQSLGQKNTIFAIWMGYTFMTPETSIVGGLYSIWHNLYNSWQLYKAGKSDEEHSCKTGSKGDSAVDQLGPKETLLVLGKQRY